MTAGSSDELVNALLRLRAENAHLSGLLEVHGMACRNPRPIDTPAPAASLTTDGKVASFTPSGRIDIAVMHSSICTVRRPFLLFNS